MTAVDKTALLGQKFGYEDVEIPGVGMVRIRALTRSEAIKIQGEELIAEIMECKLLALAMVEPKMTEEEIQEWQDTSPAGQMQPVVKAILKASGMVEEVTREAYDDFRGRRRP
jgi:hypothetical protein